MNGINGLGHLNLLVSDLDRSLVFYRDQLGLQEMTRLVRDSGETWLVYLRITDLQYLELMTQASNDRAPANGLAGVNHLCLTIDDLGVEAARLAAAGVVLTSKIKLGQDGNRGAWIEDPDGNRIELMEMHPDCLQYKAIRALSAG